MYQMSKSCQIPTLADIYIQVLGYKSNGYFVDVGAFDAETYSNTWGLHLAGWSGICFEPVPEYFRRCQERYQLFSKIICKQIAIGKSSGEIEIELAGAASSGSEHHLYIMHHSYLGKGFTGEKVTVPMSTLTHELNVLKAPRRFDVLSIDVEGMEMDVLFGFDIPYWKPKLVIIETHEGHPLPQLKTSGETIDNYVTSFGYTVLYHDAINTIYKREGNHDTLDFGK